MNRRQEKRVSRIGRLNHIYKADLSHRAVSVYIYLYDRANKDDECWPSIPTIAKELKLSETSVYKGYKQDKIEMRGDRAEMSDFPLYLNTVAGGLDRRDQTIGGFSFVVKIYALPVVEIIG